MNKAIKILTSITVLSLVCLSAVYAATITYYWESSTYTIVPAGLSSKSEIVGDRIVTHVQTVKANITNSRATSATGTVKVEIVNVTDNSVIATPYATTTITISGGGATWSMPNYSWTPTASGTVKVKVTFVETY